MTARIPLSAERAMSGWLSDVETIRRAMSGATTIEAIERAEAAVDRMLSKNELRMTLRSAKAACRENRRPIKQADDFSIPAMPAGEAA